MSLLIPIALTALQFATGQLSSVAAQAPPAARPAAASVSRACRVDQLKGMDLQGRLRRIGEGSDCRAMVLCFLSTQCPISNGYLPQLNEMASRYRRRGVEFYGVVSDPSVTRKQAFQHQETFGIRFPVLFDASCDLRQSVHATHTPQAIVLDPSGRLHYSGAIDDRHVRLGRKKDSAAETYLEDAIDSVVERRPVAVSSTQPIGCLLEDPPNRSDSGSVTYTRDIAPLLQANCVSCHRSGQAAPFTLMTYDDVSAHANQVLEVTHSRFMPPWKPTPGFERLLDEIRLTASEIALLEAWVQAGKPLGDPADMPKPTEYIKGWQLGEPDLVLEMSESFSIPASGPDIRQYFVIPSKLTENRLVSAIEFQPGSSQSVHHASFYLDTHRAGRKLDAADPAPGYGGFGGPRFETQGTLSSWFPGMSARKLPRGYGRLLPSGSDIVAEIHYVSTGKPERDRSKVGLYFASRSAKKLVVEIQVGNKGISIPAGDDRHKERATYRLPVDTTLFDLVPHMHVLGQEVKVWSRSPDGQTRPLLWIKDWDFNWQGQYAFAKPVRLPRGTEIIVDAWFDNSAANPLNPNQPPKRVRWGDDSTDEMLLCHFQCTCETMDELKKLVEHQVKYIAESHSDSGRQ